MKNDGPVKPNGDHIITIVLGLMSIFLNFNSNFENTLGKCVWKI